MKKFEWKWRQKCNHPQCDKRAGYGKRDFSPWSLAALDEKYCLEQLRGEAGNTLYFVGLCETGARGFLSLPLSLSRSLVATYFFHLFVLFSVVRRLHSSVFCCEATNSFAGLVAARMWGGRKIEPFSSSFVLNTYPDVCCVSLMHPACVGRLS